MTRLSPILLIFLAAACANDALENRPAEVAITPLIDFGTVYIGDGAQSTFDVSAVGPVAVRVTEVVADHPELSLENWGGELLVSGRDSETISVRWDPIATGEHTGRVLVFTNVPGAENLIVHTTGLAVDIPPCEDGNPCTDDVWDPAAGACISTDNGGACDDGETCTGNDRCQQGVCRGDPSPLPVCNVACPADGRGGPVFAGNWFEELWSSGPNDIWAVGEDGISIHYDGAGWSVVDTCSTVTLFSVWGNSPNDVWAVGSGGTVLNWDGLSWNDIDVGTNTRLWSVWGTGPNDMWISGDSGLVLRKTAMGWGTTNTNSTATLWSILGNGAGEVWVVGSTGEVLNWSGSSWTPEVSNTSVNLFSVRAAPDGTLLASGGGGTVIRRIAGTWTALPSSDLGNYYNVWGLGADDFWVSGENGTVKHYDNGTWIDHSDPSAGTMYALWGNSDVDLWSGGTSGVVRHFDGMGWAVAQP